MRESLLHDGLVQVKQMRDCLDRLGINLQK